MLFTKDAFKNFTGNNISNLSKGTEVLFSFDADSKDEVDEIAKKYMTN
ncbi:hypothetical protein [Clostridium sp.]|nr:hypothetical protein [uncultured Clostridium sp.]